MAKKYYTMLKNILLYYDVEIKEVIEKDILFVETYLL